MGDKKDKDRSIERSRSKSRERGKKKRDRSDRHRDSRERDEENDRRDRKRDRDRSVDRERDRDRNRDRDRRDRGGYSSRNYDDRDHGRRRSRSRGRGGNHRASRSRSRSYERRRREKDRDYRDHDRDRSSRDHRGRDYGRSSTQDRDRYESSSSKLSSSKEEPRTDSRFDLTQTIQELMNSTTTTKNFANLFNCTNSNDSFGNDADNSLDGEKKRKKKSRWGGTENDKTFIPGMPTILPSTLDPSQQEAYLVQLQIEEISRKLRTGDLGIPQNPEERSPSPEPIYSSDGKRLNTREFRFRKRLEEQRHQLIMRMQSVNPDFKPPADYKPPVIRVSDKVLIPQEEHPDINFVGLLIGPRGNTLKGMEKETGAKIIIRGKGSVKEGKVGRKDGQPLPGEDEPLHAFITASNPEAVKKAVEKIKDVIRQGIEVPEGHNDLRRMQLRELAQLNGTLRETDCPRCTNCGSTEHKSWLCPDKPNITNSIVCSACGGAGHISKDCRSKRPGAGGPPTDDSQAKIDEEYMSLMAELGEGPPPAAAKVVDPLVQAHINRGYSLFDKKPSVMQAIQAAPAVTPVPVPTATSYNLQQQAPPPPIPPPAWATNGTQMPLPPLIPPPPGAQPPPPGPPPHLMPWMTAQPPPPGGETMNPPIPGASLPPPPGTGPPVIPPPPGTTNAPPLPPWASFGGWNSNSTGYAPPPPPSGAPPPPPCAPLPNLIQPPPPPPPS